MDMKVNICKMYSTHISFIYRYAYVDDMMR